MTPTTDPVPQQTAHPQSTAAPEQPLPAAGEKWCCTTETGTRTVTVTRVWDLGDGYGVAVAFEWRDDKPRTSSSALRLPVFLGTYKPEPVAAALAPLADQPAGDTLPEWLCQRYRRYAFPFDNRTWAQLPDADRSYWAHEAAAVRRAVTRGGFKTSAGGEQEPRPDLCPRCESPAPHLHPATQADGGEVQPCTHPFHQQATGGDL